MSDALEALRSSLEAEHEGLLTCVHCGFCLPACPTYRRLGDEADSPRGRLHLMRAVAEGRLEPTRPAFQTHIDRCLGCRACEPVCPSGVPYGHLLEQAQSVARAHRRPHVLALVLPWVSARRWVATALFAPARWIRGLSLLPRVLRSVRLPRILRRTLAMLVVTHPAGSPKTALGPTALTARSGSVVHLDGCIQRQLFDHVNTATHRVLAGCGLEVKPWAAGCCGALHAHAGDLETARALARRNIEAFERAGADGIAVNAAGCGAALKAYGTWFEGDPAWAERAARFAAEVRDIAEVVTLPRVGEDPSPGTGARSSLRPDPGPGRGLGVRPDTDPGLRPDPGPDSRAAVHPEPHDRSGSRPLRVAWDPPCHQLHAQGIDAEARELLRGIPGVECVEVPRGSECCGGAGLYGITHPDLGDRITHDKLAAIESTGCDVVATSNPGCMMQIGAMAVERGIDLKVVHPIELVAWSLDHRIHSRGSA